MVSGVGPQPPLPPSSSPLPLPPPSPVLPSPLPAPLPPEGLGYREAASRLRGGQHVEAVRAEVRPPAAEEARGAGSPGGWRSWAHPVTGDSVSGVTPVPCWEPERPRFCQRRSLTPPVTSLLCHPAARANV